MITLHLPKGDFFDLGKEISVVKNIKDTTNRKNTAKGLRIIQQFISKNRNHEGISLYWNDEKLIVEPYKKQTKSYYCGRELNIIKEPKEVKFTFVVIDLTGWKLKTAISEYLQEPILKSLYSIYPMRLLEDNTYQTLLDKMNLARNPADSLELQPLNHQPCKGIVGKDPLLHPIVFPNLLVR